MTSGEASRYAAGDPGEGRRRLSQAAYARAEQFLPWNAERLMGRMHVEPQWIDEGTRFWYRVDTTDGHEFVTVDPAGPTRSPSFDHVKLAAALSRVSGIPGTAQHLPFDTFAYVDASTIRFDAYGSTWSCDLESYRCDRDESAEADNHDGTLSPDGKWIAFARDHNLFVRSTETGYEVKLTDDGVDGNAYGTPLPSPLEGAGIVQQRRPTSTRVIWAPDSSRFVSYQIDQQSAGLLHLVQSTPLDGSLRPRLHTYVYPLPGDTDAPLAQLVIADVPSKSVVRAQHVDVPMLYYGSPLRPDSLWWSDDSRRLFQFARGRGYQSSRLSTIDPSTGASKTLVEESAGTAIDPHPTHSGRPMVRVLDDDEILWFSQQDGWGHLYLVDAKSDAPWRQITSGPWMVTEIMHVDQANRLIYVTGVGREPDRDPYFNYLYRVRLDGGDPELLTPEDATHQISFSPAGSSFVDTYSRVDLPPVTVLRSSDGDQLLELEHAETHLLEATGWKPPLRFQVKGRDGKTDIFGTIIVPSWFHDDGTTSLPILDSIYAGPQTNQSPTSFAGYSTTVNVPDKFRDAWHAQALAELGFAVVMIDGVGMPFRAKAFHDGSFRNLGDGGIEDHVVAIQRLARQYPYLDVSRVGIFGHSAGGYASTRAILMFPEFYQVAVSTAGNHDHPLGQSHLGRALYGTSGRRALRRPVQCDAGASLEGQAAADAWGDG